jgi:hypothetical protein
MSAFGIATQPCCREGRLTGFCAKSTDFPRKNPDETIFAAHVVVLKQSRDVVAVETSGDRVMPTIENDSPGSESWDPALWSIGTVLGVAIVYLACLT